MKLSRRRLFYLGAGAGGALLFRHSGLRAFSKKSWALGSETSIALWHDDPRVAAMALSASFEAIDQVEDQMSLYRPDSQLVRLNQLGFLNRPHPDLVRVLRYAQQLSARSAGAFDVTVQPLWQHRDQEHAVTLVDWRQLDIGEARIAFRRPGMQATLNGIAQGFAADRVASALQAHGIAHALVDTGEVASFGKRESQVAWKVGLQHPRREDAFVGLVGLSDRCLATSGDYATTFTEDFSQHHLIDPRTGRSPAELSSVTVAATSAMEADALSTAAFVLGLEKGMALIEQMNGTDAMMIRKADGQSFASAGFPTLQQS